MEAGLAVARFAHLAATAVLFGTALYPFYGGRPVGRGIWRATATAALLTGLVWMAATAASMSGLAAGAVDPGTLAATAFQTDFGRIWIGRLVLLALIAMIGGGGACATPAMIASGMALGSIGLTGHAIVGEGGLGLVHRFSDAIHLLCAGAWIGGLFGLWMHLRRGASDDLGKALLGFSAMGLIAVGGLAASGLVNAALLLDAPSSLFGTAYGRLLCVKLGLFAGMLGLATLNRFSLSPRIRLGSADARRTLRRSVVLEQLLAAGLLAAVAVLGTLDPAV
jgi:putative copper resistance protein D